MNFAKFLSRLVLSAGLAVAGCGGDDAPPADAGPDGSAPPPDYASGAACTSDADCTQGGACRTGFQQLGYAFIALGEPEVYVGLSMPGGYCSNPEGEACASDAECGPSGACYRPLEGATDTSALPTSLETDLLAAGICLKPCTADTDCRQAEGYRCQVPLQADLADVVGAPTDTYCVQDQSDPCAAAKAAPPSGSCTLAYDLEGQFQITGAPLNDANVTRTIGPGQLVLRVDNDGTDQPSAADGPVEILCYDMEQRMNVAAVITAARVVATDTSPVATGQLTGGTTIDMASQCVYNAATYGNTVTSWVPTDAAAGTSCVHNYHSYGDVNCTLSLGCGAGGLMNGHNPQDATWDQPFSNIAVGSNFSTVAMTADGAPNTFTLLDVCDGLGLPEPNEATCDDPSSWGFTSDSPEEDCYIDFCGLPRDKTEIPNSTPTRTWINFTGTLADTTCTP